MDDYVILAEAHSDDRRVEISFNALPYFRAMLEQDKLSKVLEDLDSCGFGGDCPADEVAEFFEDSVTKKLFDYMEFSSGYECYVDRKTVAQWLRSASPKHLKYLTA